MIDDTQHETKEKPGFGRLCCFCFERVKVINLIFFLFCRNAIGHETASTKQNGKHMANLRAPANRSEQSGRLRSNTRRARRRRCSLRGSCTKHGRSRRFGHWSWEGAVSRFPREGRGVCARRRRRRWMGQGTVGLRSSGSGL